MSEEKKFDVREHMLVPKHEVMSEEKKKEMLERFKISYHQLPVIKSSDPVAEAIGAKPGDVLKITRESQTAGRTIVYRYVING